ncbi:hypothetical protein FACS189438_0600 [Bacteroidia bacterium]|nr:hypothetical protein FACS189438_0600 [Bacteroidia bacterium]
MKSIYKWIFLLFACGHLAAQTAIVEYEYWLDNQYAGKIHTGIPAVQVFNWQTALPFQSADVGLHLLNVRFRDSQGLWSPVVSSPFYKAPNDDGNAPVACEYWLDSDYANRVSPTVTSGISADISFKDASVGLHSFNIRFKDKYGRWSSVESRYFQKLAYVAANRMVTYEYWLNDNYEEKQAVAISPQQAFVLLDEIDIHLATKATNTIYFRFKDELGLWSNTSASDFWRPVEPEFTHIVGLSEVTFANTSKYADKYEWDFGDGKTSDQVHPTHTYAQPGAYQVKLIAHNKEFTDSVFHYVEMEGIQAISSNKGGNGGVATVIFYGGGLTNKTQVILQNSNEQIKGENIKLIAPGQLEVEFNLINKSIGMYDIDVSDATTFGKITLTKSYTIEGTIQPEVWAEIIGNDIVIDNRWQTYTISYGNKGNVDAIAVPIWLVFSDVPNLEIEFVDFEVLPPVLDYALDEVIVKEILETSIFIKMDQFQNQLFKCKAYPLIIPKIPSNYTGQVRIRLKTDQSIRFKVWIDDSLVSVEETNLLRSTQYNNNPRYKECRKTLMEATAAQTFQGYIPGYGCFSDAKYWGRSLGGKVGGTVGWGSFVWNTAFFISGCVLDYIPGLGLGAGIIVNTLGGVGSLYWGEKDCGRQFPPIGDPSNPELPIRTSSSLDPNEILGPSGYGEQNFIQKKSHLNYALYFENDAEKATAPAQEIFLTDTLDLAKFNPEEFSFGTFTFRDMTIEAIPGVTEFSKDVDMRERGENIIVRISATFDKEKGIIHWHLIALDPETMDLTESPYLGILYPNTTPPIGDGNVTYRIGVKDGLPDGTVIKNQAYIIFDLNEPIATNVYINTFDYSKPKSRMSTTYKIVDNTNIEVSWSGSDTGSGIRDYTVYVSDNNGEYRIWQSGTTETAVFEGAAGHRYAFYVVATDNAGNVETKERATELTVSTTVGIEDVANDEFSIMPNPIRRSLLNSVRVRVSEERFEEYTLTVYSLTGARIREINLSGPSVNVGALQNGVYMFRLQNRNNGRSIIQKMIVTD